MGVEIFTLGVGVRWDWVDAQTNNNNNNNDKRQKRVRGEEEPIRRLLLLLRLGCCRNHRGNYDPARAREQGHTGLAYVANEIVVD